jgi:hypothetical protein
VEGDEHPAPKVHVLPGRNAPLENLWVEAPYMRAWLVPKLQQYDATRYHHSSLIQGMLQCGSRVLLHVGDDMAVDVEGN